MEKWFAIPKISLNSLHFGMPRSKVRASLNLPFKSVFNPKIDIVPMDAYRNFHVFYDSNNLLEAIEFYSDVEIVLSKTTIFPGTIDIALKKIPDLIFDGYDFWCSNNMSVGIGVAEDGKTIDSILFGTQDYYK